MNTTTNWGQVTVDPTKFYFYVPTPPYFYVPTPPYYPPIRTYPPMNPSVCPGCGRCKDCGQVAPVYPAPVYLEPYVVQLSNEAQSIIS